MVKIAKIGKWTFAYLNPIYWTDEGTDFVGQTAEVWFTNKERCVSRTQCAKTSTLIQVLHKSSSSSSSLKSSSSKSSSFGRLQRDHLHQSWIKMMPYPYPCWKFIKPYYSVSNIALQCVPIVANTLVPEWVGAVTEDQLQNGAFAPQDFFCSYFSICNTIKLYLHSVKFSFCFLV